MSTIFIHFHAGGARERTIRLPNCISISDIKNRFCLQVSEFQGCSDVIVIETHGLETNYEIINTEDFAEAIKSGNFHFYAFAKESSDQIKLRTDAQSRIALNLIREGMGNLTRAKNSTVNIFEERMDENFDISILGNVKPLFADSRITISALEDVLSAYRISWGGWKSSKGHKTIEDLYEEILHKECCLFASPDKGVIRVVEVVKVKIINAKSKLVLVEGLKMMEGQNAKRDSPALPGHKCKIGESPFRTALAHLYNELGDLVYEGYNGDHPSSLPRGVIKPLGFDLPTTEFQDSNAFPGLNTCYHKHTLMAELHTDKIPSVGSFTCRDLKRNQLVRLWQWIKEEDLEAMILKERVRAEAERIQRLNSLLDTEMQINVSGLRNLAEQKKERLLSMGNAAPMSLLTRLKARLGRKNEEDMKEIRKQIRWEQVNRPLPKELETLDVKFLRDWLENHGIETRLWGTGQAKSVQQLLKELQSGEAELSLVNAELDGDDSYGLKKVLRVIKVAKVEILHPENPDVVLVESHQVLPDGRIRVRFKTLSEKFKPSESAWQAAIRGVVEELFNTGMYIGNGAEATRTSLAMRQIEKNISIVAMYAPKIETEISSSYPNLETRYILHRFACVVEGLPVDAFRTEERSAGVAFPTVHHWKWVQSSMVEAMNKSLIHQVQFYRDLTDNQDIDIINEWIFKAAAENHVDVLLLLCGVEMNKETGEYILLDSTTAVPDLSMTRRGETPLRIAALNNSRKAVECIIRILLLKLEHENYGDDDVIAEAVNEPDTHGCTLLYYAAVSNCVQLATDLLTHKSAQVNSVCLHSCIARGAVEVLPTILSRLRNESQRHWEPRILFGVEKNPLIDLTDPNVRKMHSFDPPKAESFATFESLMSFTVRQMKLLSKRIRHSSGNERGPRELYLRALEILLQYCKPFYIYQHYLAIYLQEIIDIDDRDVETKRFFEFVSGSQYPLHAAINAANCLKYRDGVEKRVWESYNFHENNFQDLACSILDCCDDQEEAEEILRERSDLPVWYTRDGVAAQRSFVHRRKSTCAFLAVKYMLKKVVAHKYFTTQNNAIWFGNTRDSMYMMWLGALQSNDYIADNPSNSHKDSVWSSLKTFFFRIPGFSQTIVRVYRLMVSILLMFLLTLASPLLAIVPFSYSLRVLVDLPRTEYSCCYYRWSVWGLSYVVYLASFTWVAARSRSVKEQDHILTSEWLLYAFWLANVCAIIEQIDTVGLGPYLQYGVNAVDVISAFFTGLGVFTRLVFFQSELIAYDVFMSIGSMMACFRLFHMFSASKSLGPLWITIVYVASDVAKFLCLLGVTIASFMLAFLFLVGGNGVDGFEDTEQTFTSLLWSTFEAFTGYNPNQTYQKALYQFYLFFFLIIAAVLLTNLLIAMMTDRYNAVQQTARVEWLFSLAQLIEKYTNMPVLPPPLNLLIFVPNYIFRMRHGRISLYDPDSLTAERMASADAKHNRVHPYPDKASDKLPFGYNLEEVTTLNYRTTRRMVVQRFQERAKKSMSTDSKIVIPNLYEAIGRIDRLIVSQMENQIASEESKKTV